MEILPSERPVPHDPERGTKLVALLERLKKRFVVFVALWVVKVVLFAFGFGTMTPFQGTYYDLWLLAHNGALTGLLIAFVLFADATIRTAQALEKDRTPFWAYFAVFPMCVVGFPFIGRFPFSGLIYNAILASPYVVYRMLARELEEEIQALSGVHS